MFDLSYDYSFIIVMNVYGLGKECGKRKILFLFDSVITVIIVLMFLVPTKPKTKTQKTAHEFLKMRERSYRVQILTKICGESAKVVCSSTGSGYYLIKFKLWH